MNRKSIVLILIMILFCNIFLFSNDDIINLETEAITEIEYDDSIIETWGSENKVYFYDMNMHEIDLKNKIQKKLDRENYISYIKGEYDDDMIVSRVKKNNNSYEVAYLRYNPNNGVFIPIQALNHFELIERAKGGFTGIYRILHYIGNKYFIVFTDHDGYWATYQYDTSNNTWNLLFNKEIIDISPDKTHLILRGERDELELYNIVENEVVKSGGFLYDESPCFFYSNNLIVYRSYLKNIFLDLNLQMQAEITFNTPKVDLYGIRDDFVIRISNSDCVRMLAEDRKKILCKILGEKEALDSLGLLFHPTTATLNDDRVRMREWPLLDAKHLAFLEEGEEVEVLDRSGIKVMIGDMEDYWYQIKRSDGQIGWSYGVFLDIAEEE